MASGKVNGPCPVCRGRRVVELDHALTMSTGYLSSPFEPTLPGRKTYPCPECRPGGDPVHRSTRVDSHAWSSNKNLQNHLKIDMARALGEMLLQAGRIRFEEDHVPDYRAIEVRASVGGPPVVETKQVTPAINAFVAAIVGRIEDWGQGATYRDDTLISKSRVIQIIMGAMADATKTVPSAEKMDAYTRELRSAMDTESYLQQQRRTWGSPNTEAKGLYGNPWNS